MCREETNAEVPDEYTLSRKNRVEGERKASTISYINTAKKGINFIKTKNPGDL